MIYIIKDEPLQEGSRPPIQSWQYEEPPRGFAFCPEAFIPVFTDAKGFVDITLDENGVVVTIAENTTAKVAWEAANLPGLPTIKQSKLEELSQVCNTTITAGCGVTLTDGNTGHISMTDEDQINLMSALAAVQQGAAGYPYHLDGDLCRIYSAEDIAIMVSAATRHKLYHTTYCNHLNVWVKRCETVEEVQAITYSASLPDDLAANMAEVLSHAG